MLTKTEISDVEKRENTLYYINKITNIILTLLKNEILHCSFNKTGYLAEITSTLTLKCILHFSSQFFLSCAKNYQY